MEGFTGEFPYAGDAQNETLKQWDNKYPGPNKKIGIPTKRAAVKPIEGFTGAKNLPGASKLASTAAPTPKSKPDKKEPKEQISAQQPEQPKKEEEDNNAEMPDPHEERRKSETDDSEKKWPRQGEEEPEEGAKFSYQPKLTSSILPKLRAEPTSDVKFRCSAMGGCDDTKNAPLARESGWATGSAPEMRSSFLELETKVEDDGKLGKEDGGGEGEGAAGGPESFLGSVKRATESGGEEKEEKDEMPEVIPRISPSDYPKLEWQDREKNIPAPVKYNKKPPPYVKYDAPHRWTQELGFKPLTRKDFPRWIDEDPDKNWIARKYPPKRVAEYKKRFADFGWKKPHKTLQLTGIASTDELGEKDILPAPEKLARKFWHENDDGKPMEWTTAVKPD